MARFLRLYNWGALILAGLLTGDTAEMLRKLLGAFIGLAMMGMVGPALADNGVQGDNVAQFNLDSLEDGLRETDAIGLGKKLSLKKDFNRLVDKLHAFHQGTEDDGIDKLESSFHQLVDKTLSLLRAEDPDLHQRISAGRSGIWAVLRDRETFLATVVVEDPPDVDMYFNY